VGSGFRTFTAGEVLTASNVQNYLMDQSVMVFGGSAARSSAIGTANFEEGMVSYLTDTDKVEAYNGTNWVSVAPTTSQGLTLINTTSFSGVSTQTFTGLTSTYNHFRMIIKLSSVSVLEQEMQLRLSLSGTPATGNDYIWRGTTINTAVNLLSSQSTFFYIGQNSNNAPANSAIVLDLVSLSQATRTNIISGGLGFDNTQPRVTTNFGVHNVATAYNEVVLLTNTGTFTGEASIFGYAK
jgi:hypothetical protein